MENSKKLDISELVQVDRIIHEPARAAIMAVLVGVESADFKFLMETTRLTKGNLSVHSRKLRDVGYVEIKKSFQNNYPHTNYMITKQGKAAFKAYLAKIKLLSKVME